MFPVAKILPPEAALYQLIDPALGVALIDTDAVPHERPDVTLVMVGGVQLPACVTVTIKSPPIVIVADLLAPELD